MRNLSLASRRIVLAALTLLAAALVAPSGAAAAPEEGSGTLLATPSPIVLPATTAGTQSAMQTFSFEYQGSGEVNVQKLSIEGAEAGEFNLGGSNCGTLSAGQKCDAWIALKPGSVGTKQAELRVVFVGLHPEEGFAISGEGVPAEISLDPSSFDYGLHRINRESIPNVFQLTNDGEAAIQVGNIEIGGDSSVFWTGSSSCWSTWLAPGQSCAVEVDFGPRETRTYAAELRVLANGATATAALSGEGGRAIVEPPAKPVDLGAATVGTEGEVGSITLLNTGNLPESFFIGIVAGGDSASFRLLDETCSGHPLAPLETCVARVRFEPQGPGPKAAHLAFFGDGEGGVLIDLRAEGIAAAARLTPAGHDFGALPVGTRSAAQDIVVANDGAAALQLDSTALAGADAGQFALAGDGCTGVTLAPGEMCVVRVRFWPEEAGEFAATLRIGGPSGSLVAALSGRGLASGGGTILAAPRELASPVAADPTPLKKARRHRRFARNATIVAPLARWSRLRR